MHLKLLTLPLLCSLFLLVTGTELKRGHPECCTVDRLPQFQIVEKGVKPKRKVCDQRVITYERKSPRNYGVRTIKLKCDNTTGKWIHPRGDESYEDVDVQLFVTDATVKSRETHVVCKAEPGPNGQSLDDVPLDFLWKIKEEGIIKQLPRYDDRHLVPRGVTKYSLKMSQTKSELVIEQVENADLQLYSCEVSIGGVKKASRDITLIENYCEGLSSPLHGTFRENRNGNTKYRPDSLATPICHEDFIMVSNEIQQMICTVWGKWAAVDQTTQQLREVDWENDKKYSICKPTCKREIIPSGKEFPIETIRPPQHTEAKQQNVVWPNTTFTYTCLDKYELVGSKTRMCTDEGTYTAQIPTCQAIKPCNCPRLNVNNGIVEYLPVIKVRIGKRVENGNAKRQTIKNTCRVSIHCDDGYSLRKEHPIFCNIKDSQWVDKFGSTLFDVPTCKLRT